MATASVIKPTKHPCDKSGVADDHQRLSLSQDHGLSSQTKKEVVQLVRLKLGLSSARSRDRRVSMNSRGTETQTRLMSALTSSSLSNHNVRERSRVLVRDTPRICTGSQLTGLPPLLDAGSRTLATRPKHKCPANCRMLSIIHKLNTSWPPGQHRDLHGQQWDWGRCCA